MLASAVARTAIGLSLDHRYLYLFSTRTGMTGAQLVTTFMSYAQQAGIPQVGWVTNEDGGGSSQLYATGVGQVVDSGRMVANHLGVIAKGSGPATNCPLAPRGYLDSAVCEGIQGWGQDANAPTQAVSVQLTFDGAAGGSGVPSSTVVAGDPRSDLCTPLGSCDHAFSVLAPLSRFDSQPHMVHAYELAPDGSPSAELTGSPKTFTCAPPALSGVKRWVVDISSFSAWNFSALFDELAVDDATLASLGNGPDLPAAPKLVRSDSGDPSVWLVDGSTRRHVPSPTAAAHWHFDLSTVQTLPDSDVRALAVGPELGDRPILIKGSGPAVYLLDPAPAGDGDGHGAHGSGGGCNTTGDQSAWLLWAPLSLALLVFRRLRRVRA